MRSASVYFSFTSPYCASSAADGGVSGSRPPQLAIAQVHASSGSSSGLTSVMPLPALENGLEHLERVLDLAGAAAGAEKRQTSDEVVDRLWISRALLTRATPCKRSAKRLRRRRRSDHRAKRRFCQRAGQRASVSPHGGATVRHRLPPRVAPRLRRRSAARRRRPASTGSASPTRSRSSTSSTSRSRWRRSTPRRVRLGPARHESADAPPRRHRQRDGEHRRAGAGARGARDRLGRQRDLHAGRAARPRSPGWRTRSTRSAGSPPARRSTRRRGRGRCTGRRAACRSTWPPRGRGRSSWPAAWRTA